MASELLTALEMHATDRLAELLAAGLDPRSPHEGKTPVAWLLEMYTRSDAFPECLRQLLAAGGELPDPVLAPVLLDDPNALWAALDADPGLLHHRTSLISAFTPLVDVPLLHVAAEFGHLAAARVLVERGADVDARAGVDAHGLGGHTALFHTVHSHDDRSAPVRELLLAAGARVDVQVAGLVWGRGFEWETVLFDLTPISYAQLGTLPQMHRRELDVARAVGRLLAAADRPMPPMPNVPNRYLAGG